MNGVFTTRSVLPICDGLAPIQPRAGKGFGGLRKGRDQVVPILRPRTDPAQLAEHGSKVDRKRSVGEKLAVDGSAFRGNGSVKSV